MSRVTVCVTIEVENRNRLYEFARDRYAECWGNPTWEPANEAEAVYEALVASNMNPSPAEYGIDIVDVKLSQ